VTGAEPDIFIWGATGGASFATRGAVNGLCRTFGKRPTERDLILGGSGTPQASPLLSDKSGQTLTLHRYSTNKQCGT